MVKAGIKEIYFHIEIVSSSFDYSPHFRHWHVEGFLLQETQKIELKNGS